MSKPPFIRRLALRNFKSVATCDVPLQPLTWLVGRNGSGKSNFLDALHFVRDALADSLDSAINRRGGLNEVRRRSSGHPNHFVIRLEFGLPDGRDGIYAFRVGALAGGGFEVQDEWCRIGQPGGGPSFRVEKGRLVSSSEGTFPAVTPDRLALVALSGVAAFRPAYDALTRAGFYNLSPERMRELQKPQDGRLLKPLGENIASVIGHLESVAPAQLSLVRDYLRSVAPMVHDVGRKAIGPMETLEFRQDVVGARHPWRFMAQNMSDGTLRALGVLVALLQGGTGERPRLVGIEEPETALHPAASAALREALMRVSGEVQVIITSHSPDLLDDRSIPADSILAVTSDHDDTRVAPLDPASRKVLREHLFSAGELLRLDQLAPDAQSLAQQARLETADLFTESGS